ncbi:MAG TPA: coenzyme F420-0:L-glutamate ligase [Actinomycetota bacterium]|nr:coenzyme F420-0:L-glutamate ligase [Actinomycetota bacterium]
MNEVRIVPVAGVPEVRPGDDLGALLADAAARIPLEDGDVLVVTQKVVSKAEGRVVAGAGRAAALAVEAKRVLRRSGDMVIAETAHGFVCANAGIDASNVPGDDVVLLPLDPDASARRIRARVGALAGADVAVVVSDTFGRAWRLGQTDVAIGVAGIEPFVDYRGTADAQGRVLTATRICVADELAAAAEMVMGKAEGVCAAVIRGARVVRGRGSASQIVRPPSEDLFR